LLSRSAPPVPGWSTISVEMPRRASSWGNNEPSMCSLKLSNPFHCTMQRAGPFSPADSVQPRSSSSCANVIKPVGHRRPGGEELLGARVDTACRSLADGSAGLVDLADRAPVLQGDQDRQVPHVVAGEVLEHHCPS
jgi:hypothetical protein